MSGNKIEDFSKMTQLLNLLPDLSGLFNSYSQAVGTFKNGPDFKIGQD